MLIDEQGNMMNGVNTVPSGIVSATEQELIKAYLQGAVYAWCNCRKQDEFRFATFTGGDNYYWEGTYLYPLYENQPTDNNVKAVSEAAKYGGMLLKQVLISDKRTFVFKKVKSNENGRSVNVYYWIGK